MQKRAIQNQRNRYCDIEQSESIKEKDSGSSGDRSRSIKYQDEKNEPEDSINSLNRELCGREDKREKGYMPCHRQRPKGTEISSILQCHKAEGYYDKEDGFLMNMPTKQEGGVAT